MKNHPLAGVYVAAVTPLQKDGSIASADFISLMAFYAQQGAHGVLFLGTTGEGPSFNPAERESIFRAAARARTAHPHLRLLAGTGTPSLSESIELTRAAFRHHFDGVVVLPPFYFRNASDEGLFRWYDALIRAAVPENGYLLGYHIPKVSGVGLSLSLLERLKTAHPQRFAGIKDSSHDPQHARDLGAAFGADLLVLNGTDSYLSLAMDAHAQGCITAPANLFLPQLRAIWEAKTQNKDAKTLQSQVTAAREILEQATPFPPILKALLHRFHRFPLWDVRPPLLPADEATVDALSAQLAPFIQAK